jgi:uncharacterized protein YaaQ
MMSTLRGGEAMRGSAVSDTGVTSVSPSSGMDEHREVNGQPCRSSECTGGEGMILAIVSSEDVEGLTEAVPQAGFRVTFLSVMGGFLRRAYATLLIGTVQDKVDVAMELIKDNAVRYEARLPLFTGRRALEIGAATVFVLDLEASRRY